jgi:hypothetical protein
MKFSTKMIERMGKMVAEEMKRCGYGDAGIYDVEQGMREFLQQIGQAGLACALEERDDRLEEEAKASQGERAYDLHSYREAVIWSVFGKVRFERRYYRYREAKEGETKGFTLLDQKMGFKAGEVTPGLAEILALEGISTPFEEAAKKIEKTLLIRVSDNTVRKETEAFGGLQAEIEAEWIRRSQDEAWLQQREREAGGEIEGRIYGSVDGFLAPLREGWKEFKALAWYKVAEIQPHTPKRHHRSKPGEQNTLQAEEISYHCDKATPEEFGKLLWATGCQRKVDFYQERVFVGDGAKWIWKMVERYYPDATQILDWYHASQYLYQLAEAAFDVGSEAYETWLENTKTLLWEGEVGRVIAECERLDTRPGVSEAIHTVVTFYTNNKKRMDYARFRAEGYFIGSGTIESAAKRLGELRLKEAGARWTEEGAVATAKARAAWLGDQWNPLVSRRSRRNLPLAL